MKREVKLKGIVINEVDMRKGDLDEIRQDINGTTDEIIGNLMDKAGNVSTKRHIGIHSIKKLKIEKGK